MKLKQGDEVVVMYAVVPKEFFGKVSLPVGSMWKGFHAGRIENLVSQQECLRLAKYVAVGFNTAAKRSCPDFKPSIIHRPDFEGVPV